MGMTTPQGYSTPEIIRASHGFGKMETSGALAFQIMVGMLESAEGQLTEFDILMLRRCAEEMANTIKLRELAQF